MNSNIFLQMLGPDLRKECRSNPQSAIGLRCIMCAHGLVSYWFMLCKLYVGVTPAVSQRIVHIHMGMGPKGASGQTDVDNGENDGLE